MPEHKSLKQRIDEYDGQIEIYEYDWSDLMEGDYLFQAQKAIKSQLGGTIMGGEVLKTQKQIFQEELQEKLQEKLQEMLQEKDDQILIIKKELADRDAELADKDAELADKDAENARLRALVAELQKGK